mmetsp:Transcript_99887/g.287004  ORF Transcript_99887/g.287004 Transcript_99887/m.287004 type:complete len:292 (-) Transcript_99887:8-883(-)
MHERTFFAQGHARGHRQSQADDLDHERFELQNLCHDEAAENGLHLRDPAAAGGGRKVLHQGRRGGGEHHGEGDIGCVAAEEGGHGQARDVRPTCPTSSFTAFGRGQGKGPERAIAEEEAVQAFGRLLDEDAAAGREEADEPGQQPRNEVRPHPRTTTRRSEALAGMRPILGLLRREGDSGIAPPTAQRVLLLLRLGAAADAANRAGHLRQGRRQATAHHLQGLVAPFRPHLCRRCTAHGHLTYGWRRRCVQDLVLAAVLHAWCCCWTSSRASSCGRRRGSKHRRLVGAEMA